MSLQLAPGSPTKIRPRFSGLAPALLAAALLLPSLSIAAQDPLPLLPDPVQAGQRQVGLSETLGEDTVSNLLGKIEGDNPLPTVVLPSCDTLPFEYVKKGDDGNVPDPCPYLEPMYWLSYARHYLHEVCGKDGCKDSPGDVSDLADQVLDLAMQTVAAILALVGDTCPDQDCLPECVQDPDGCPQVDLVRDVVDDVVSLVNNPCQLPGADTVPVVCGGPVPNPCPEGVDALTASACGTTLCPTGVVGTPGPGQVAKVCGTGVNHPCPQGVDPNTAKACSVTLCPTGVVGTPAYGQVAKVCGTPINNPCNTGVNPNTVSACGSPSLCPAGLVGTPDPGQVAKVCGVGVGGVGNPCASGVDANTVSACGSPSLCPAGLVGTPGPGQVAKVCGYGVGSPCTSYDLNKLSVCGSPPLCTTGVVGDPEPGEFAKVCGVDVTPVGPCLGASLLDLDLFDTVIVSSTGGPDPALVELAGSGVTLPSIKYWTPLQYDCVFPETASGQPRNGVVPLPGTWADSPGFQAATGGMAADQKAQRLVPDPVALASGKLSSLTSYLYIPESSSPLLSDAPLQGNEARSASPANWDGSVGLDGSASSATPATAASSCTYPDPPASAPAPHVQSCTNGLLVLRVVVPENPEDKPDKKCHDRDVQNAQRELLSQFAQREGKKTQGDANAWIFCYLKSDSWGWDACMASTGSGNRECTSDTGTLLGRFEWYVNNVASWMKQRPSDLVTTFVWYADNFGMAPEPGQISLQAENAWYALSTDTMMVALIVHELGHNFGAHHHPDDSLSKYICNNGWDESYDSVMNYCAALGWGYTTFDGTNWGAVKNRMYGGCFPP